MSRQLARAKSFLFSGYFHVNSLRKKFHSIEPRDKTAILGGANQELLNSINRLLLNVIDCGTDIFGIVKKWKAESYLIKTLMLRTANVAVTVVFVLGEKQYMDEIICEEQWLILTKELIKCTAVTSKGRNLKEFKSAIRHTDAKKAI